MKTNIGITEKNTDAVAVELAKLLADEFVLYTKTRNAHWNVIGDNFHANHIFLKLNTNNWMNWLIVLLSACAKLGILLLQQWEITWNLLILPNTAKEQMMV